MPFYDPTRIISKNGVPVANQPNVNFIEGTNVTLTITEDVPNTEMDVTITAAGGGGTPATSVTDETTYGISTAVGVSTNYARQDHTHGTMATPTKTTVGLANVDNTSDAGKPVSTAQQTALDLKAPLASPTLTGTVTVPDASFSLAKLANMATSSLYYRKTAGAGVPEVNTLATLKTDLLLTGTNSGDQTSIVGITGTIAQFNTAITDGDMATGGGTATGTNTGDQTLPVVATGAEVDTGTNDTKFASPKAMEDSLYIKAAYADAKVSDTVYGVGWNGDTTVAPSKNAVYDKIESIPALTDGDKGDITVSGSGLTWTIDNGVVTAAKTSITGTPTGSKYLRDDFSWQAVAGGSFTATETEVDFGTIPVTDALFTITDAAISTSSKIIATSSGKVATGRVLGDDQWDSIVYSANPGTGNFTLYAKASGSVVGKRKVQYSVAT